MGKKHVDGANFTFRVTVDNAYLNTDVQIKTKQHYKTQKETNNSQYLAYTGVFYQIAN